MKKCTKVDAKHVVLPHSQAKLDLYRNYLLNYLRVLCFAPFCNKINLYDIFCGVGVYEDGNEGSPLITNNCINQIIGELTLAGKSSKPIHVHINDKRKDKVENVQKLLGSHKITGCDYFYYNKDADIMLDIVSQQINSFKSTERNLVFIDPYGYSNITKDKLYNLLRNETTEVILFLPINQMNRFTEIALTDYERTCYVNLRNFITSFFHLGHKIHTNSIKSDIDFIYELKEALTFNDKFYSCAHYIERGRGNYYSLFFITSNLYGLEKMVEAKWKLDPAKGQGFNFVKNPNQTALFQDDFTAFDQKTGVEFLKNEIILFLKRNTLITNYQLYELALKNAFTPSKANEAIKDLIKSRRVITVDNKGNFITTSRCYLSYDYFKRKESKVIFKYIK